MAKKPYYLSYWSSTCTALVYKVMPAKLKADIDEVIGADNIKDRQFGNIINDLRNRNEFDLIKRVKRFIHDWNERQFQYHTEDWEMWDEQHYNQQFYWVVGDTGVTQEFKEQMRGY